MQRTKVIAAVAVNVEEEVDDTAPVVSVEDGDDDAAVVGVEDGVDAAAVVDVTDGVDASPRVGVEDGVDVMATATFSPRVREPSSVETERLHDVADMMNFSGE